MIDLNLFSNIENECVKQTSNLLSCISKEVNINRFDSSTTGGTTNVKSGSFDGKTQKPSINISVLAGSLTGKGMPGVYQMNIDVYFSVVITDISNEGNRRNKSHPLLLAILWNFTDRKIEVGQNGEYVTLKPKGEFLQKFNESPYLEYVCCFTCNATVDKSEETDDDGVALAGVLAQYFAKPQDMPYTPPEYAEKM